MGNFLAREEERGLCAAFLACLRGAEFLQYGGLREDGLVRGELIFLRADEDVEDW